MEKARKEIGKEKKAYEKPRIVYQQSLEAIAVDCTGIEFGKNLGECTIAYS